MKPLGGNRRFWPFLTSWRFLPVDGPPASNPLGREIALCECNLQILLSNLHIGEVGDGSWTYPKRGGAVGGRLLEVVDDENRLFPAVYVEAGA
jgi:hypothetical protein